MDTKKIREEVGEIIDRLAVIYDEEDPEKQEIADEIKTLAARLKELTGKTVEECQPFEQYWSYTSLEDVVDRIFMPSAEAEGMSDEALEEWLTQSFDDIVMLPPAKLDREIEKLEKETGIPNVSDYIFWSSMVEGLGKNASKDAIIAKIIEDRKR